MKCSPKMIICLLQCLAGCTFEPDSSLSGLAPIADILRPALTQSIEKAALPCLPTRTLHFASVNCRDARYDPQQVLQLPFRHRLAEQFPALSTEKAALDCPFIINSISPQLQPVYSVSKHPVSRRGQLSESAHL
ncbi:hypothetical protein C8R47DRAFT_1112852 [Mycena vitilis]|nr:hypothetical protein C8R47DRAFT_1112852 [Mycena vitilis]